MPITPDRESFRHLYQAGTPQLVWRQLVSDLETPVGAILKLADGKPFSFLFESVIGGERRNRYSFLGLKPDLIWRAIGNQAEINRQARTDLQCFTPCPIAEKQGALASLRALIRECRFATPPDLPPMAAGLFGYLGYDCIRWFEKIPNANPDSFGVPDALFVRPTMVAIFDSIEDLTTLITPVWVREGISADTAYDLALERLADVISDLGRRLPHRREPAAIVETMPEPVSNIGPEGFKSMVRRAIAYIHAGDAFQILPSQRFSIPFKLPPLALYRALRRLNPSPFLFYMDFGDFSAVGSSPEVLVRLRDRKITLRPLAGTRRRGDSECEDAALSHELLTDPKERAEHLMLIDLGRNDVGNVAEIGSVVVTECYQIEYYSHVMHIVSNVEGKLRDDLEALDALIACFPAGTVSGAPKIRAMEIIDELEPLQRKLYAGAVGYFAANGAMDTCITLRTALLKEDQMYVQAAAGVVADSDPVFEEAETRQKAQALFRAAEEALRFAADQG